VGPGPPDPDRLKYFWTVKYDLRNHSRPLHDRSSLFDFYGQKIRISPNSLIFVCYSPRLPSGSSPPDPDRQKFFWDFKYDLRNHSHRAAMIVPLFYLHFYGKNTRNPPDSHIFVCYSPRLASGPGPPGP